MVKGIQVHGEKLAQLRREKFFSQERLARAADMARESIRRIERKEVTGVQLDNFLKLAAAFNITPDELNKKIGANGTPHPTTSETESTDSPVARIGPRTLHLDAVPEIERDWIEAAAARDGALPAQVMLRLVLKGLAAERRERPDDELGYGEAASPRDSTDDPRPKGRKPKRPQK